MKTTLALLAATTALGALFASPSPDGAHADNRATATDTAQHLWVHLVSDDDHDDEDDDCEMDGDDEDENDDDCMPTQPLPPTGNGTPPKVQVN